MINPKYHLWLSIIHIRDAWSELGRVSLRKQYDFQERSFEEFL